MYNIIINHSNLKYFRCPVFTGTVKKAYLRSSYHAHALFNKKAPLRDSISKIFPFYIMIRIPQVYYGLE